MTPFEAYRDFIAVKRHFMSSDYDYLRYNGKVRVLRKTFDESSSGMFYEKIARHHDPHWLIVANLVEDPAMWVGEVARDTERYARHRGRAEALDYTLRRDLEGMSRDVCLELSPVPNALPGLAHRYYAGTVSVESAAALSAVTGCGSLWSTNSNQALREAGQRLVKYCAFLRPNVDAIRPLVAEHFKKTVDAKSELVDK